MAHRFLKLDNRIIMLVLSAFTLLSLIAKINFWYDEAMNIYWYILTSLLLLSGTLATEVSFTGMFGYMTPPYIVASYFNAGKKNKKINFKEC